MTNLPAVAEAIGGNLPVVLKWEQHALLPRTVQYAIARIVKANPQLNTEERVDMLADMASYHSEEIDLEVAELVEEFGAEMVYHAVDWLYEDGRRNREGGSRSDLRKAVAILANLAIVGVDVSHIQHVDQMVRMLGGLSEAASMNADEMAYAIDTHEVQPLHETFGEEEDL